MALARQGDHDAVPKGDVGKLWETNDGDGLNSASRRRDFYTQGRRYHGATISYRTVLSAVSDGLKAGLLEERRARPGAPRRRCRRQSCIRATPLLCRPLEQSPVHSSLREVILLRHRGRLVDYKDTSETRQMRCEVEAINSTMSKIVVDLDTADVRKESQHWIVDGTYLVPSPPTVRRIFSRGSFDKGGRAYGWWQGLPSRYRAAMTVNGEPVLEPDFGQFHAVIIYGLRGLPLVGDAYETAEFSRSQGKLAFSVALNAATERGAVAAIAHHLKLERGPASLLLRAIKSKHRLVADLFCSDAGVSLMRIDSDIILNAVKDCQSQGIAALPVHDSPVVPARHAGKAADAMVKAFACRIRQSTTCQVRIKSDPIPQMEERTTNKGSKQ